MDVLSRRGGSLEAGRKLEFIDRLCHLLNDKHFSADGTFGTAGRIFYRTKLIRRAGLAVSRWSPAAVQGNALGGFKIVFKQDFC